MILYVLTAITNLERDRARRLVAVAQYNASNGVPQQCRSIREVTL